ncbi:hypothetical protein M5E87_29000 [Flavonifractor plautii]|nr:hypothetical protein M5E87_29000 [Flavonifractor plautii]
MIQVVLRNAAHPEYGEATIPFPIPEEEYGHCLELLEALEIGNAVNRDCKVQEIQEGPPILKRLEGSRVNLDELDYLAKRLDSFTDQELAQFQSAAVSYDYSNIVDLINLTFSCQGGHGHHGFFRPGEYWTKPLHDPKWRKRQNGGTGQPGRD